MLLLPSKELIMKLNHLNSLPYFSTCFGLYGHIFIPASYWNDLGDYCNRHIPYILKQMSADDFVRDIEKVFLDHPLKVFPVAHYHFVEVCHFLESVLETWIPNWTLSTDINDLIKSSGHGTTGLTSWQGALFLTDWLLANKLHKMKETNIMELGCGVGFTGLHLLATSNSKNIKSYTFTDCHKTVLEAVNFNIMINLTETKPSQEVLVGSAESGPPSVDLSFPWSHLTSNGACTVLVEKLDWLDIDNNNTKVAEYKGIDLLLGADIVYERSLIQPLVQVMSNILGQNANAICYICCTERSDTTLAQFEKALVYQDMVFSIVARHAFSPSENFLCSDVLHQRTRIYEIKMNTQ